MKITQHGENLFQLTRMWVINCYLVREENGLTLVDSGLPGSATNIFAMAQQLGQPITRLVLTHAHGDHVGSLDAVAERLPDAEIALTDRTTRFLAGDQSLDPAEPQVKLRGGFQKCDTRPTRVVAPGDQVGSLRVVASPGHSPDHIAFFDERDGTLIAGDAFQTQGGLAVAGQLRWRFPLPALATWHKPTALSSARQLLELEPTRLAVGHGRVMDDPQEAMKQAIAEAEKNLSGQIQNA